jgi:hypothetical protein
MTRQHALIAPMKLPGPVRRQRCRECGHPLRRHPALLLTEPPVMLCERCPYGVCPDADARASDAAPMQHPL